MKPLFFRARMDYLRACINGCNEAEASGYYTAELAYKKGFLKERMQQLQAKYNRAVKPGVL